MCEVFISEWKFLFHFNKWKWVEDVYEWIEGLFAPKPPFPPREMEME